MNLDILKRESELLSRNIWCDLYKTHKYLRDCKPCDKRDNCEYRNNGAMQKVKVNFDNWILNK